MGGPPSVTAALPAAFGLGLGSVLLAATVWVGLNAMTARGLLTVRRFDGEIDMQRTGRARMKAGVVLLAAAAIVGIMGYVKISVETAVAVQLVYLASAGFGVIILAVAGGALLVAEQLRTDEARVRQLEDALAGLGDRLAGFVAEPPRLLDRNAD